MVTAGSCGPKQAGPRENEETVKEKTMGRGVFGMPRPQNLALS